MQESICPICEDHREVEHIERREMIDVRGEKIPADVVFYRCAYCQGEFEDMDNDYLDGVYREYRKRKGFLQPEEIRQLRKQYGLTQKQLSDLLGWGYATLSRYENGALQDEAHDTTLQLLKRPANLLELIEKHDSSLPDGKKEQLIEDLRSSINEECSFPNIYLNRFGGHRSDIYTGFRELNLDKIFELIKFHCHNIGVFKTKLLKLLFYTDFKHYKYNAVSITGSKYAHAHHGPVPDKYEFYLAQLIDQKEIRSEEVVIGEHAGEELHSNRKPDLSLFTDSELKTMLEIKEHFQRYSAKAIREFSHEENGYKNTKNGEVISYEFADELRL
jgi:putative zinc finger/helix-turn-helix YgiT family protein